MIDQKCDVWFLKKYDWEMWCLLDVLTVISRMFDVVSDWEMWWMVMWGVRNDKKLIDKQYIVKGDEW